MDNKVKVEYSQQDLLVFMNINKKKIELYMTNTYFYIKKNGKKFAEAFGDITDDEDGFNFINDKTPKINSFLYLVIIGFSTWKAIKHESWKMLFSDKFDNEKVAEESKRNFDIIMSNENIEKLLKDFKQLEVVWKEKDPV